MTQVSFKNLRLKIAIFATTAIVAGSIFFFSGCDNTPPIEISLPETTTALQITQVYIDGVVNNPGFYPLEDGDTIESLIQTAGGVIGGADNGFGHPNAEVIQRLEEEIGAENIYRTDRDGTIEFITDGDRLWVETGE